MYAIQTRLATLEAITDDLNVVRFKPSVTIDPAGLAEILQTGHRLNPEGRISVVAIIPEDADFDIAVMREDHGRTDRIKVMAVVCESTMFQCLTEMYLRYFPQLFPVKVFSRVEEAIIWLEEHPEHRSVA